MAFFTPPTYTKLVEPHPLRPIRHFLTESVSVVRVNGLFVERKTPAYELLVEAGQEGIDYFLGGREYPDVPESVAIELHNAGFPVTFGVAKGSAEGALPIGPGEAFGIHPVMFNEGSAEGSVPIGVGSTAEGRNTYPYGQGPYGSGGYGGHN